MMDTCVTYKNNGIHCIVTYKNNSSHCIPQPELPDDCLKLIFDKLTEKKDRDSFGLTCHNFFDIQNSSRKHLDFRSSCSDNDCANYHDSAIRLSNHFHHLHLSSSMSSMTSCAKLLLLSSSMSSKTSCDKLLLLFHRFNNLESLSLTNNDKLLNSSIKKSQIYLCRLHSLDLSDCSYVTDKGLKSAASCCPTLSVIRLRDCKSITDMGLKFLTKFCKSLKQVDLSGCSKITDIGIGYINQNCRQLRALSIYGCRNILGLGFLGISKSLVSLEAGKCRLDSSVAAALILSGGGLEYLNLSFYWRHKVGAVGLEGFGANIKVLEINDTNDAIINIAKGCPLLQEWNLSNCHVINVSDWEAIALYCQNLKTIHLSPRFNDEDDELMDASLIALSHCRMLSVIYMCIEWDGRRCRSHEIRDMMRKDVKIIEYEEESKNTISWDSWDFTI